MHKEVSQISNLFEDFERNIKFLLERKDQTFASETLLCYLCGRSYKTLYDRNLKSNSCTDKTVVYITTVES